MLSGCVLFADPSYENPCGGTELLLHDGHAAIPNARCGVCDDGYLACEGPNRISCLGATFSCTQQPDEPRCGDAIPNLCGGCQDLPGEPGTGEGCDGEAEVWVCTGTDDARCMPNPGNICGGTTTLTHEGVAATPALPCGPCNHGVLICDIGGNLNVLTCFDDDEDLGANACEGCNVLLQPVPEREGDPPETCGCGGLGAWACAEVPGDGVICDGAPPHNGCGGCQELGATPGSSCGDRMIVACNGANDVACVDQDTHNSCGGSGVISLRPGQSCGEPCDDGTAVCTTPETIACVGASAPNACGACGFGLPFEPNSNCGPNHLWVCGGGELICAEQIDPDEDGAFSQVDNCPDARNEDQADYDEDGIGDACDDSDGDGVMDDIDPCPEVPHDPDLDVDGNDIPDGCEDTDGDAISNAVDNCPEHPNPLQEDFDGDGIGDLCDADYDGDGWVDESDNCPGHPNPGQEDQDEDGIGDACAGDMDEDGFMAIDDCDDSDPGVNPHATEVCDGIDNDCSGAIDDDAEDAVRWFRDFDRDGVAGDLESVMACEAPDAWYQREAGDCDDVNRRVYPGAGEFCDGLDGDCDGVVDENAADTFEYWRDDDGDGYGAAGDPAGSSCLRDIPEGAATNALDCNDEDRDINPDARELCRGEDENCNGWLDDEDPTLDAELSGTLYYFDADGDGFGDMEFMWSCDPLFPRLVEDSGDCRDDDPDSFPGARELCDGVDNSCSGTPDDVLEEDLLVYFEDFDGDGFGNPDSTARACSPPPGFVENSDDCDDVDEAVNPDATEDAGNLIDEDCVDGAAPYTELVASEGDRLLNVLESPYRVVGDFVIEEGTTLTVPECVEFLFEADASLTVFGELIVDGSADCPVVMQAAEGRPAPGFWSGVHFQPSSVGASYGLTSEWIGGSLLRHVQIFDAGSRDLVVSSTGGVPAVEELRVENSSGIGLNYTLPDDAVSVISVRRYRSEGLSGAVQVEASSATIDIEAMDASTAGYIAAITADDITIRDSRFYDTPGGIDLRAFGDISFEDNQLWTGLDDAGLQIWEADGTTEITNCLFVGGDPAVSFTGITGRVVYNNNIIADATTGVLTGDSVFSLSAQSSQFLRTVTALRVENTADAISSVLGSSNLIQGSSGTEAIFFGVGGSRVVASAWTSSAFYEVDGNFVYSGHSVGSFLTMTRNWWEGLSADEAGLRIYDSRNERTLATVSAEGATTVYPADAPAPAPIVLSVTLLDDGVVAEWEPSVDRSVRAYRAWLMPTDGWHRNLGELVEGSGVLTSETTATFDLADTSGDYWFYVNATRSEDEHSLEDQLGGHTSWFTVPVQATP